MIQLRPYQREAVEAVYRHLRERDDNPCVVIPTAGGKTPILATICRDAVSLWNGRVLVLAHVKELLEQAVEKLQLAAPELMLNIGIYSAGLGCRDTEHAIIVAGIQSVYKRAKDLGRFDLVIVDEAHLIPPDGDGTYRSLLTDLKAINPALRIIGLTATPFRLAAGSICDQENILNTVCFEVGVRELIVQGYLCPLITKAGRQKVDTKKLHTRAGEFVASEVEALMDDNDLVLSACREIIQQTQDRHSVLIFASGVKHGEHVRQTMEHLGAGCRTVFGDTLEFERAQTLDDFKAGRLKYLVNVNVLTTGFDAPNIDCVALLRPTLSPGLYYQMVGRGFRLHSSKQNCLVLDFGGNALRHGPVDMLKIKMPGAGDGEAPAKECPDCHAVIACGYTACPHCGHVFERKKNEHEREASTAGVISGQKSDTTYDVMEVLYGVHCKRGAPPDAPRTMRVDYRLGFNRWQSEWICLEHGGFARQKAENWWVHRSAEPIPDDVESAVTIAQAGGLLTPRTITIRSIAGEEFDRIIAYEFPERENEQWRQTPEPEYEPAADEIPF
jgi:DNA repair protein RadD